MRTAQLAERDRRDDLSKDMLTPSTHRRLGRNGIGGADPKKDGNAHRTSSRYFGARRRVLLRQSEKSPKAERRISAAPAQACVLPGRQIRRGISQDRLAQCRRGPHRGTSQLAALERCARSKFKQDKHDFERRTRINEMAQNAV